MKTHPPAAALTRDEGGPAARAKPARPARVRGSVPAGYHGPVYYRTAQDMHAPIGRLLFDWTEKKDRLDRAFDYKNRRNGFRALIDDQGQLLPEWKVPLQARIKSDRGQPPEFQSGGVYTRVSDRIYDAILSLEPDRHPAIPIDARRPNGTVERWHALLTYATDLDFVLDPVANELEPIRTASGTVSYDNPYWFWAKGLDMPHFGYLSRSVVGDHHLFHASNGAHFFSPELFRRLFPFGDILSKHNFYAPMGVAG